LKSGKSSKSEKTSVKGTKVVAEEGKVVETEPTFEHEEEPQI